MRVRICAVGRLRPGPEKDLVDDYLQRFDRSGRALGLGPSSVIEVEARKRGGPLEEGALLQKAVPAGAKICVLDERGTERSSPEFAQMLARWRDEGVQDAAFCIGGADGHESGFRTRADTVLTFGKMVWPHLLARVMLAEQLYRASAILAGAPSHRE